VDFKNIHCSDDYTYHIINNRPLYKRKFLWVLKYHPPGLAPVGDDSGAYHIKIDGSEAYSNRYIRTFGFYENLAAVMTNNGWGHIDTRGIPVYPPEFDWVGNFQEKRCTVRSMDKKYYHIYYNGKPVYKERYLYAGDFRDGIAVVRLEDGMNTHISINGDILHDKYYRDLDVYHKGYARARDDDGWLHIDLQGNQAYDERYMQVEPFYNGYALVWCYDGKIGIISEDGKWVHTVFEADKK